MGNVQSLEEEESKRNPAAGHEYYDWVDELFICDAGQVATSAQLYVCGRSLCTCTASACAS